MISNVMAGMKVANKVADMVTWLPPWWPTKKIDIYMEIQFGESWSGGMANWVSARGHFVPGHIFVPRHVVLSKYCTDCGRETYCPGKILYCLQKGDILSRRHFVPGLLFCPCMSLGQYVAGPNMTQDNMSPNQLIGLKLFRCASIS